jgi:hypothetical protein
MYRATSIVSQDKDTVEGLDPNLAETSFLSTPLFASINSFHVKVQGIDQKPGFWRSTSKVVLVASTQFPPAGKTGFLYP